MRLTVAFGAVCLCASAPVSAFGETVSLGQEPEILVGVLSGRSGAAVIRTADVVRICEEKSPEGAAKFVAEQQGLDCPYSQEAPTACLVQRELKSAPRFVFVLESLLVLEDQRIRGRLLDWAQANAILKEEGDNVSVDWKALEQEIRLNSSLSVGRLVPYEPDNLAEYIRDFFESKATRAALGPTHTGKIEVTVLPGPALVAFEQRPPVKVLESLALTGVAPGKYSVAVSSEGYLSQTLTLELVPAGHIRKSIQLELWVDTALTSDLVALRWVGWSVAAASVVGLVSTLFISPSTRPYMRDSGIGFDKWGGAPLRAIFAGTLLGGVSAWVGSEVAASRLGFWVSVAASVLVASAVAIVLPLPFGGFGGEDFGARP